MPAVKSLNLYLIKPSKYDEDGYVIRHWKGVLPSNTLACLNGLSEDLRRRRTLGRDLKLNIFNIDETVERVDVPRIIQRSKSRQTKTVVCLVGVQSNQFPRASDLALSFRKAGIEVLIGGFHVSGVISTLQELPGDLARLRDAGVTLVAGEVEENWEMVLRDALEGTLKPVYNFLRSAPDLLSAPMPVVPKNLLNRYAVRRFATLDCGRGCPFACSFCTVIQVQGRVMRFRPVESIIQMIRENYRRHHISFYFFTDDNFSRNKNWRAIFEALIRLRLEENIRISFMMQVDTQSHRIPDFVEKAAEAGCSQVFLGLESLNEENLEAAGKKQNKVADFRNMMERYHALGIVAHTAYIIGFPFDSEESVRRDMSRLQEELNAKQASFFMLTPLPGSMDYKAALARGMRMDADLNNFDSFHETFRHERMPAGAWARAYEAAWKSFYSTKNMIRVLKQTPWKKYWGVFLNFIWYKNAIQVEGGHPMVHGFFRLKNRSERRASFPRESFVAYYQRRVLDIARTFSGWFRLFLEMEEVWLATRYRNPLEERLVSELGGLHRRVREWRSLRVSELEQLYRRALASLEKSAMWKSGYAAVPSRFHLWANKWNLFYDRLTYSRSHMTRFWKILLKRFAKGNMIRPMPLHQILIMSVREFVLLAKFMASMAKGTGVFAKT